jgi:adenylosuccinate synthase
VVVRYSIRVNGFDSVALTKLDVLDHLAEIKVCVAYRCQGETIREMPADLAVLEACEPVYETLPGWSESTGGVRDFSRLPPAARRYVDRLADLVGGEIGIVSTGPERDDTIVRRQSAVASWFA